MEPRRDFLKKIALAGGAVFIAGISDASPILEEKKRFECAFQLGGKSLEKVNQKNLTELISKGNSLLKIVSTDSIDIELLRIYSPDAVLFGGKMKNKLSLEQAEELLPTIPLVNSNFSNRGSIPAFRILSKNGVKIGVMGIGFEARQRIGASLQLMNDYSTFLREEEGCKRIYCITDDPGDFQLPLSLRELVVNSAGIDSFFASSQEHAPSKLSVYSNRDKKQVLLHVHSLGHEKLAYFSQTEKEFIDFKKI